MHHFPSNFCVVLDFRIIIQYCETILNISSHILRTGRKEVNAMMEMLKDLSIVFLRIVTIFPLMLFVTLFMGRRTIGEMPVFDFLVIIALGAVVGADIADPSIHHLPTAFAILIIALLQKTFSIGSIRYRWFGKIITFEPVILIYQGKIVHKNLKKVQYSVDNVLQLLREQQIFDVYEVHLGILEANGKISVIEQTEPPQPEASITFPVIKEGNIDTNTLSKLGLKQAWLEQQLAAQRVELSSIFLAMVDQNNNLTITQYEEDIHQSLPPVIH